MTDEEELFAQLSAALLLAHRRVAAIHAPEGEKASITKHLLVISDASKHDLARAATRLDAFLADLDARFPESRSSH
jgi:hypothetical protein